MGSFSPKERAKAVSERIQSLARLRDFSTDSLVVESEYNILNLVYSDQIVTSISEEDALWSIMNATDLSIKYQKIISEAILNYQNETNIITLLKEFGLALLVLIITYLVIKYIFIAFRWTAIKIHAQENKRITGIKIKDYTLFDASRQVAVLINLNTILKWLVVLSTVYIALPILFGIFPWTKDMAQTLFGYVLDPLKDIGLGLWNYLPNLITVIVIIVVFRYVLKGLYF